MEVTSDITFWAIRVGQYGFAPSEIYEEMHLVDLSKQQNFDIFVHFNNFVFMKHL